MIYRTTDREIREYELNPAINQSGLKVILKEGIQYFLDYQKAILESEADGEDKEHFLLGGAVDCLITAGLETYKDKYATIDYKPSPAVLEVLKKTYSKVLKRGGILAPLEEHKEDIHAGCIEAEFRMNQHKEKWEDDSRIALVLKEDAAVKYWQSLMNNQGKKQLTEKQASLVESIANSITTHPFTAPIFQGAEGTDIDIIYQLPLYFNIDDIPCKILLDVCRINHFRGIIYPLDIKTTRLDILRFNEDYKNYRYDIQGSFYTKGLKFSLIMLSNRIGRDVTGYTIAPFSFIVESKRKVGNPLIFSMPEQSIMAAETGEAWRKGWFQALHSYRMWKEVGFSIDKMFEQEQGRIFIEHDYNYSKIF